MARVVALVSDPHQTEALRLAGEIKGHEVVVVASPDEALGVVERRLPDVLVCDLWLSPADEVTLAPGLRASNVQVLDPPGGPTHDSAAPAGLRHVWVKLTAAPGVMDACEPRAFLAQIRSHVEPSHRESEAGSHPPFDEPTDMPPDEPAVAPPTAHRDRVAMSGVFARLGRQGLLAIRSVPVSDLLARVGRGVTAGWRLGTRHVRWLVAAAAAVAVIVGVSRFAGWLAARPTASAVEAPVAPADPPRPSIPKKTGRLQVTSDPDGASVVVDGRLHGVAPLAIDDLAPGTHLIELRTGRGLVRRQITVRAGETASVAGAIFPGWLVVFSPIELQISENGRAVRLDDNHQVILEPGRHELLLVNQALGYRDVTVADIKPGERMPLSVVLPKTSLSVTTTPPSEVWIDGAHAGDTPLVNAPVEIGTRDVVLKHASLGERHVTVTATVAPVRLDIDLTQPER